VVAVVLDDRWMRGGAFSPAEGRRGAARVGVEGGAARAAEGGAAQAVLCPQEGSGGGAREGGQGGEV
jgi:hypothetical protein